MIRRVLRSIAALLLVIILTPIASAGVALASLIFLPLPATLPTPKPTVDSQSTHVYDAVGNEIAVFKEFDTSIPVQQSDIPQVLKDAVVASEDRNFYSHGGVDIRGTLRALWSDLRNEAVVEGGSTITQQYAKLAFTTGERTLSRKIREAILASQLDRELDKDTILYRYLSVAFFGDGAYGIGAAAQTYFRKPVSQLTVSESALLAGVLPAPTVYAPREHAQGAEERREHVLDLMHEQHMIDDATYTTARAQTIWLASQGDAPGDNTIVYPPEQTQSTRPWFSGYVHLWLEQHLPGCTIGDCPQIENGGLKVYTTLDPAMEDAAEQEVARTMGDNDPNLQMALVSVEPPTGYVRAMVGGRDFSYNQTNTALSPRQPGSSFKPFILAEAFEQGVQPTSTWSGAPLKLPDGETISNYGGEQFGTIDLRTATWDSVNAVYARLVLQVGVDKAMDMANRLGAPMPTYDPSRYGASVALGAIEVSPLNMASAYSVFANHGTRAEPTPVYQVVGPDGQVIIDNSKNATKQVVNPVVADNVTDVLQGVLTDGTAAGKGIDRPAAGKTGTASDAANAWFVGYTPTLSTAVWMGHLDCGASTPDRNCGMYRINGVREVVGGTLPAATWQRYMKLALAKVPATEFSQPAPIQQYADAAKRAARHGYDPGVRQLPTAPPASDGFVSDLPPPAVLPPTTSTSTTNPGSTTSTSTTSTTTRRIIN